MVEVNFAKLDELERRMVALDRFKLLLGVLGENGGPTGPHPQGDGLSIADVASIHEHGTDTLPARPIVSGYLADGGEAAIARDMEALVARVMAGADPRAEMQALADRHAAAMRARFDRGIGPAIGPERDDNDSRPLHDSGAISRSIRAHVGGT